jgi:hypothetical protein
VRRAGAASIVPPSHAGELFRYHGIRMNFIHRNPIIAAA